MRYELYYWPEIQGRGGLDDDIGFLEAFDNDLPHFLSCAHAHDSGKLQFRRSGHQYDVGAAFACRACDREPHFS